MEYVSLNGKVIPVAEASFPVTDPATQYGFGLFEVTRAYHGVPFRMRDHLDRMRRSARTFGLRMKYSPRWVDRAVRDLCGRNRLPDARVRLTLTAGGNFLIRTRPLPTVPKSWRRTGAKILLCQFSRDPESPLAGHKTLNYLENTYLRERAHRAGAADSLLLGPRNEILEGCASNLFLVKGGILVTPSLRQHILPGVTRKVVLEIASRIGLRTEERPVFPGEIYRASEVFLTNVSYEILPITRLGSKRVGAMGPITPLLQAEYRARVEAECRSNY